MKKLLIILVTIYSVYSIYVPAAYAVIQWDTDKAAIINELVKEFSITSNNFKDVLTEDVYDKFNAIAGGMHDGVEFSHVIFKLDNGVKWLAAGTTDGDLGLVCIDITGNYFMAYKTPNGNTGYEFTPEQQPESEEAYYNGEYKKGLSVIWDELDSVKYKYNKNDDSCFINTLR